MKTCVLTGSKREIAEKGARHCYHSKDMNQTSATLDRLVEPVVRTFTPEVARALVQLRADPALQGRVDELAQKCNEGRLTPEEGEEYETGIRFASYLAILQTKARRLLKEHEPA